MYDDLITNARELCERNASALWPDLNGYRTLVPQLCDALEAAQKENERLNKAVANLSGMINQYADQARNAIDQQEHDRAFYEKSVSEYNSRAEKAEAERDTYKAALQNWHEPQEGAE